jgi:integrase
MSLSPAAIRAAIATVMGTTDTDTTDSRMDRAVSDSRARRLVLRDPLVSGLQLRVSRARYGRRATCVWSWAGRDGTGRMRTFGIGRFPHLSLTEARDAARQLFHQVRYLRHDPVAEARQARAARAVQLTLAQLLDRYGSQCTAKSWHGTMAPAVRRVFGAHLATPLDELRLPELQASVDAYPAKQSASFGVRCILPALRWGADAARELVDPALLRLRTVAPPPRRDRVLTRQELHRLLPVLHTASATDSYAIALRLILLTLVRRGELARARWRDVDLAGGTWHIPETKNGQPHTVPLSRQAKALLAGLHSTAGGAPGALMLSDQGKPLSRWSEATARLQAQSDTTAWQRHDLRRTGATLMGEMGTDAAVIEAALNHAVLHSSTAAIYNRSRYTAQVAEALQRLADMLASIEHGGATVHRLVG